MFPPFDEISFLMSLLFILSVTVISFVLHFKKMFESEAVSSLRSAPKTGRFSNILSTFSTQWAQKHDVASFPTTRIGCLFLLF